MSSPHPSGRVVSMSRRENGEDAGAAASGRPWLWAAAAAGAMILLSFLAFVYVPNTLLGYFSTRVVPVWRDLIVVGCWAVSFAACCWVFLRLQRRRGA